MFTVLYLLVERFVETICLQCNDILGREKVSLNSLCPAYYLFRTDFVETVCMFTLYYLFRGSLVSLFSTFIITLGQFSLKQMRIKFCIYF